MALLLAAIMWSGCAASRNPLLPEGPVDFSYAAYNGVNQSLSAFRGRPLMVLVMATWAGPALVEVQRMRVVQEEFDKAFNMVVLVLDEEPQMAAIFAEKFELTESVGWVPSPAKLVKAQGPFGPIGTLPTSILLDAEGRIVVRSDGPWPPGALERSIKALQAR